MDKITLLFLLMWPQSRRKQRARTGIWLELSFLLGSLERWSSRGFMCVIKEQGDVHAHVGLN